MSKNDVDLSNLMYKSDDNLRSSNVGSKKQQTIELPENIEKLIQKPKKEIKKKDKPQQPSEDEVIQKRRLKEVLQQYLSTFPVKLKSFKKINLEKQDLEQLKELQIEMDFCISNTANIGTGTELVLSGINAFEFLCINFTPLQIAGLHEAMKNDPDSMDTIKHLCLKHLGSSMISGT
jgi:hypothetical protein